VDKNAVGKGKFIKIKILHGHVTVKQVVSFVGKNLIMYNVRNCTVNVFYWE
jgi:hypothetical protein